MNVLVTNWHFHVAVEIMNIFFHATTFWSRQSKLILRCFNVVMNTVCVLWRRKEFLWFWGWPIGGGIRSRVRPANIWWVANNILVKMIVTRRNLRDKIGRSGRFWRRRRRSGRWWWRQTLAFARSSRRVWHLGQRWFVLGNKKGEIDDDFVNARWQICLFCSKNDKVLYTSDGFSKTGCQEMAGERLNYVSLEKIIWFA